jgi:hypothetical protein
MLRDSLSTVEINAKTKLNHPTGPNFIKLQIKPQDQPLQTLYQTPTTPSPDIIGIIPPDTFLILFHFPLNLTMSRTSPASGNLTSNFRGLLGRSVVRTLLQVAIVAMWIEGVEGAKIKRRKKSKCERRWPSYSNMTGMEST